jgi:hypothetical protein
MVFNEFNFVKLPPLKGYLYIPEPPVFNDSTWFSGSYQERQEDFSTTFFGLRSLYVRLNNQLDFTVFKKVNANGVVLGKENYLYESKYINSYQGKDFMGLDSVKLLVDQMKFVSDGFSKLGKQLIIIFAAGKASYYPEFIPPTNSKINDSTNYKFLSSAAKQTNLNVIDFNKWFMDNKYKSKYPLYPQYGIHWSVYGSCIAADSIIKKIEYLRHIDMPNLIYNDVEIKKPIYLDYDAADALNLMVRLKSFKMAYPKINTEIRLNKKKPRVLVISDSFYWGMFNFGISNSFRNDHFWYYNEEVYSKSSVKTALVKNLNLIKEINDHDVFIIMATEATLPQIGWGFLENVSKVLKAGSIQRKEKPVLKADLDAMRLTIKADKNWMNQIKQKALVNMISVDSMITTDAIWQLQQPVTDALEQLTDLKEAIKGDKKWMMDIERKARIRGLTVDSMLTLDAMWVLEQQKK